MKKDDLFESVLMINIAVAQIEASMTHGDNSVNRLISSVSTVRKLVNDIPGDHRQGQIDSHVNQSIVSLQYHDRLCQRLRNVSSALTKLAHIIEDNTEDMYWIINGDKHIIQAIDNFDLNQVLHLGVKIEQEGELKGLREYRFA